MEVTQSCMHTLTVPMNIWEIIHLKNNAEAKIAFIVLFKYMEGITLQDIAISDHQLENFKKLLCHTTKPLCTTLIDDNSNLIRVYRYVESKYVSMHTIFRLKMHRHSPCEKFWHIAEAIITIFQCIFTTRVLFLSMLRISTGWVFTLWVLSMSQFIFDHLENIYNNKHGPHFRKGKCW